MVREPVPTLCCDSGLARIVLPGARSGWVPPTKKPAGTLAGISLWRGLVDKPEVGQDAAGGEGGDDEGSERKDPELHEGQNDREQ